MVTLKRRNFELFEIDKEYHENFVCIDGTMSQFHADAICWTAEALCGSDKVIFCDNNAWYDGTDGTRYSVFMTENGNCMLKDWTHDRLWRVKYTK